MADDDQTNDSATDPWADLLADGPAEPTPELDFSFADAAEPAPTADPFADEALPPAASAAEPMPEPAVEPEAAAAGQLDDELMDAWLNEPDLSADDGATALTAGDDVGAGTSEAGAEEFVANVAPESADAIDDWAGIGADSDEASSTADTVVIAATAGAAAAAASASKPTTAARPKKPKKGGVGQMLGIVLGGVLALPITLGILIWGFQQDPFGLTKSLPKSVAFLLPRKFQQPVEKPRSKPVPQPDPAPDSRSVDSRSVDSGAVDSGAVDSGAVDSGAVDSSPADGPAGTDAPGNDTVAVDAEPAAPQPLDPMPADTAAVTPPSDATSLVDEPIGDQVTVASSSGGDVPAVPPVPFPDPLVASVEPVPALPDPMPLIPDPPVAPPQPAAAIDAAAAAAEAAAADRRAVEAAVEEALTALVALERDDAAGDSRKALLVDCYKRLAKVGEELVTLEQMSADAGRPIAEPPAAVVDLHGRLARHRDDLVRLGRNWLDYSKRPLAGVVLPVTFRTSRKVGPYWSSKVTLEMPQGASRDLSVISRSEPAATPGDAVLLLGIVFDGDVIWAADVRPPAEPARLDGGF